MDDILKEWDIADLAIIPLSNAHKSTWDIGNKYILKKNEDTDELLRSIELSKLLAREGVKIAHYIPTNNGAITAVNGQYCLMDKIPGCYIDLYECPGLAHKLGGEVAYLHVALRNVEQQIITKNNDLFNEWQGILKRDVVEMVSSGLYESIISFLSNDYIKLPRQLIHRDLHIRNFLFDNDSLSGWFDFDCHLRDVRIFDIASLLYYQEHDLSRAEAYLYIIQAFLDGYNKITSFVTDERKWVLFMVVIMEMVFLSLFPQGEYPTEFAKELTWVKWLCETLSL